MDKIINNEYGKIKISDNILGQLANRAIDQAQGDAWLITPKGRVLDDSISMFINASQLPACVNVEIKDNKVYFTINVICAFGKSLNKISSAIIKQLESDLPKVFKEELAEITVAIKGIKSKEVAKREIKITETYGNKE